MTGKKKSYNGEVKKRRTFDNEIKNTIVKFKVKKAGNINKKYFRAELANYLKRNVCSTIGISDVHRWAKAHAWIEDDDGPPRGTTMYEYMKDLQLQIRYSSTKPSDKKIEPSPSKIVSAKPRKTGMRTRFQTKIIDNAEQLEDGSESEMSGSEVEDQAEQESMDVSESKEEMDEDNVASVKVPENRGGGEVLVPRVVIEGAANLRVAISSSTVGSRSTEPEPCSSTGLSLPLNYNAHSIPGCSRNTNFPRASVCTAFQGSNDTQLDYQLRRITRNPSNSDHPVIRIEQTLNSMSCIMSLVQDMHQNFGQYGLDRIPSLVDLFRMFNNRLSNTVLNLNLDELLGNRGSRAPETVTIVEID